MKNIHLTTVLVLVTLSCSFITSSIAQNTLKVHNKFIYGQVNKNTGKITVILPNGRLGYDGQLSYDNKSFFSCMINGKVYSNNDIGALPTNAGTNYQLEDGVSTKFANTITTLWTRDNIDIIQEVFPFEFETSGQIVMSWKFRNANTTNPVTVQCQYLNDIQISIPNPSIANDGPIIFTPTSYRNVWQQFPNPSVIEIPAFYGGFLRDLPNGDPNVSFFGYLDYAPFKTVKPSFFTYGDWNMMSSTPWGHTVSPAWPIGTFGTDDMASLVEFPQATVTKGSTVIAGRTSYGTSGFDLCNGALVGALEYPRSLIMNSKTNGYPVNPFKIDLYLLNPRVAVSGSTMVTLKVGDHFMIVGPPPSYTPIGKSDIEDFKTLTAGEVKKKAWFVKADTTNPCREQFASSFSLSGSSSIAPILFNDDTCHHGISLQCDTVPIVVQPKTDSIPPSFVNRHNAISSTDSIIIEDNGANDLGLQSIEWSAVPGTDPSKFIVTVDPITPCSFGKYIVTIKQLDSSIDGCFYFTFTDCALNQSFDTVCLGVRPFITVDFDTADFGKVLIGAAKTHTITISALPSSSVGVTIDSITAPSQPPFKILQNPSYPITMLGGTSIQATIKYEPIADGYDTSVIHVRYRSDGVDEQKDIIVIGEAVTGGVVRENLQSDLSLTVIPNPFSINCRIITKNAAGRLNIMLTDVLGKSLTLPSSDDLLFTASSTGLASGPYLLRVSDGTSVVSSIILKK